jgi:hypothetical protein
VNTFDVVVGFGRQLMASAQAAALQDFPSVTGFHAGSKTMHTHAAANLGLISTFCHDISFQKPLPGKGRINQSQLAKNFNL